MTPSCASDLSFFLLVNSFKRERRKDEVSDARPRPTKVPHNFASIIPAPSPWIKRVFWFGF